MKIVLLIEDDLWLADSLSRSIKSLSGAQIKVIVISDPDAAFDVVDQIKIDYMVIDFYLGKFNCLTLLNEMASYADTKKIPKTVLASAVNKLNLDDLKAYGVKALLDKSTYEINDLMKLIV